MQVKLKTKNKTWELPSEDEVVVNCLASGEKRWLRRCVTAASGSADFIHSPHGFTAGPRQLPPFWIRPRKYRRLSGGERRRPTSLRQFVFVCFQPNPTKPRRKCHWILLYYITFSPHLRANIHQCKWTWKCIIYETHTSSQAFEPKWRYVVPLKIEKKKT